MRDELRDCECGQAHPWGIIRYSEDGVPLYGARDIEGCSQFRPRLERVPADVNAQELWAQTSDLNPQATLATRLVVQRIRQLGEGVGKYQRIQEQWPEFIGFVISQITDMRGALTGTDSKLARFVAHTDEVLLAMEKVSQLAERLDLMHERISGVGEAVEALRREQQRKYSAEVEAWGHFGQLPFPDYPRDSSMMAEDQYATLQAQLHYPTLGERREEPVEVPPEYTDPDEEEEVGPDLPGDQEESET